MMLTNSSERENPCFVSNLNRKASSFSPLSMMLFVGFCRLFFFNQIEEISLYSFFVGSFYHECALDLCQMLSLQLLIWTCFFCCCCCFSFFCLLMWWTLLSFQMLNLHSWDTSDLAVQFSSVQLLSHVRLFATSWTATCQASLSVTNSWSLFKLMSIQLLMLSNHLFLYHPLLLLPSIFPSVRVISNESVLRIK